MKTPNKIQQLFSSRPASVKADLVSFLKNLNCRYTVDTDEEDGITRISFTFQGGHFVANVKNGDNGVEFLMPVIASCEARYLNALRTVCNLMNTNNLLFKFTYSYDAQAQEHELNAHISFFNNAINPDTLENELEAAFHFKRQFQGHLDDAIAKDKSEDPKDVELVFNDYTREMAIIHEMEWHHEWKDGKGLQDDAPQGFTQPHEPTIHELLTKLHDLPMVTYKTLRAYVGEQVTTLQGHNKIAAAKVLNFIVEGKGKNAHAIAPSAVLQVDCEPLTTSQSTTTVAIFLHVEGESDDAVMVRTIIHHTPHPLTSVAAAMCDKHHATREPQVMLLARNKRTPRHMQQEFEYMWQEIKNDNLDDKREDSLLQLIADAKDQHLAYDFYWGRQRYLQRRYAEAVQHLERTIRPLAQVFVEHNDLSHAVKYFEVLYYLGSSYLNMQCYEKAGFYLGLISPVMEERYLMQRINLFMATHQPRVFKAIDELMEYIKRKHQILGWNGYDEDDDDFFINPHDLSADEKAEMLYNFARRCRAYALIEFDQIEHARMELVAMLDEPSNKDFAINELNYINKLQQEENEDLDYPDNKIRYF